MESLKKNFLYNMVYQILIIFLPLVTAPYISRILGVEGMGTYSYHFAVSNYFVLFTGLGIGSYGSRCIAEAREDKRKLSQVFTDIYTFKLSISLITLSVYLFYCFTWQNGDTISLVFTLFVVSGVLDISWLFFGLEKFRITVTRNVVIKIGTVVLMFAFVKERADLWKYVLIISGGTCVSQLYLWTSLKRYILPCRPDIRNIRHHIKPIFVLFIPVIAYSIYKIMDKIMLGSMTDMYQSGLYENAERLVNIPIGVITALGVVMLPRMTHLVTSGQTEKGSYYMDISIKLVSMLSSAIVFGLLGVSNVFSPVYFGSEFTECAPIINLLGITVFFVSWANVIRTQYLIPKRLDKVYVISACCGAVCNLSLNLLLIPLYGARGAAIGTIAAEFLLMFMQAFLIRKEYNLAEKVLREFPCIVLGILMMLIVRLIGKLAEPSAALLALQVVVGVVVYTVGMIALFLIRKDEMAMLFLSAWKNFRKRWCIYEN